MTRLLLAVLFAPIVAAAQTSAQYPTKPIRMIIPFAPGGASDFVGRIMQPKLSELLGQQIVVENKPGAAGNIGAEAAAKSAPDGYTTFLGNVGSIATNLMFATAASAMPGIKSGRVRPIAVTSTKRIDQLPDVPTVTEAGYPALTAGSWQGIFVPAGTPREVTDRLFPVIQKVMTDPEVISRLKNGGAETVTSESPAAFAKVVGAETERWAGVAKEAKATPD